MQLRTHYDDEFVGMNGFEDNWASPISSWNKRENIKIEKDYMLLVWWQPFPLILLIQCDQTGTLHNSNLGSNNFSGLSRWQKKDLALKIWQAENDTELKVERW